MTNIDRKTIEVLSKYAVEVEIKIEPGARLTKTDVRMLFIREAENAILYLQENFPEVLVP